MDYGEVVLMNEGEKIVATIIGGILCVFTFLGMMNALWQHAGDKAVILGVFALTAGWLFRFASKSFD